MMLSDPLEAGRNGVAPSLNKESPLRDMQRRPQLEDITPPSKEVGRKCQWRALRKGHLVNEANRTIAACNSMYQAPNEKESFLQGYTFHGISEAQRGVQAFVYEAVKD